MTAAGGGWLQLSLVLPAESCTDAEQALETLGAAAITLRDAQDQPILEPDPGTMPLWQLVQLQALFDATSDAASLKRRLRKILGRQLAIGAEWLSDQAWERAWLKHFRPMRFGERLWVCPSGYEVPAEAAVVVHLDPGLAFGTGTHATTALCLNRLDRIEPTGQAVLDYGCGSGILGIAALALGARCVDAVDIDPQAIEATRANAGRNGCGDRLCASLTDPPNDPTYDLVLANILAGPLIDLAPRLTGFTATGGRIVLSGLLEQQIESIEAAYSASFSFDSPELSDGWACLSGRRLP